MKHHDMPTHNPSDMHPMKLRKYPWFRWIPVVPLVYDDSLSVIELIAKFKKAINDMIAKINEFAEIVMQSAKDSSDALDIVEEVKEEAEKGKYAGGTFFPSVSEDGVISWTNNREMENPDPVNIRGPQGIQGIQGEIGPKGDTGNGLTISGTVGNTGSLPSDVPDGTAYGVGSEAPYTIYIKQDGAWVNYGDMQGPTGAVFTPSVSEAGVISWTNDGGLDNPVSVDIKGPKGDKGDTGEKGETGGVDIPTETVAVLRAQWDLNTKTNTVHSDIATLHNILIIAPNPDDSSYHNWQECNIRAVAQNDGNITFKCDVVPTVDVYVNVFSAVPRE